ncbi:beta-class carbonic anhydrase [Alkalicoccobacillus porphyridii]|uniref:carbonic anhydrase n=1 Tax=Alkalicoccobacillus porphyridii TaxID=2597270 RepID=A0A554A362_9BACI|nr:carbonic anhydrase [Alkalicoccobacillus porphyridii]TSB48131.1 carbonic anhydrase [Alkalicoccobacillus porphyridii]
MPNLDNILEYNKHFVETKEYENYQTTKFPNKKLVILTCMDARLAELLPRAMNVGQGDAKIIRNAGAVISHPFGSIMRSILLAVYELQAEEVLIIGHHGCGMAGLESKSILKKAEQRGVDMKTIEPLEYAGVDVKQFLTGFANVEESVHHSVGIVENHPLMPKEVPVHGLVIHPETGQLELIKRGDGR